MNNTIEDKRILASQLGFINEDLMNLNKGVFYYRSDYTNIPSYIYIDDDMKVTPIIKVDEDE